MEPTRDPDPDPVAAVAALEEPTRRRLYELVAGRHDAIGRDEAAASLGISRALAAFHLDRLAAVGLLETEYRRLTGRQGPGAGRPAKLYRRRPGELAVTLPERRYELAASLFAEALDRLSPEDAPGVLLDAARSAGETLGAGARDERQDPPARAGARDEGQDLPPGASAGEDAQRTRLLGLLRAAGYEPVVDSGTILLRNCPFDTLTRRFRGLTCATNRAFLEGLAAGLADPSLKVEPVSVPGLCCAAFHERAGGGRV